MFTNINLTIAEKGSLKTLAKSSDFSYCDIFDRVRIRIILDSPDGFAVRFQYLALPLSEPEQASFFAKWGDDIQSVISTGFQRLEKALDRILFLQESENVLSTLYLVLELDQEYSVRRNWSLSRTLPLEFARAEAFYISHIIWFIR